MMVFLQQVDVHNYDQNDGSATGVSLLPRTWVRWGPGRGGEALY